MHRLNLSLVVFFVFSIGCSPRSFISPDAGIGTAIGGGLGALTGGIIGSRHGYDRSGSAMLGGLAGAGIGYLGGVFSADSRYASEAEQARAERAVRVPYLKGVQDSRQIELESSYDEYTSETRWQPAPPAPLEYPESTGRAYQGIGRSY